MGNLTVREQEIQARHDAASQKRRELAARRDRIEQTKGPPMDFLQGGAGDD
jgi:hypothetical protein